MMCDKPVVATFGSIHCPDLQRGNLPMKKWTKGVRGLDGIIYGVPSRASSILAVNPATWTVSTFGTVNQDDWPECEKWSDGILGLDGMIYCVPASAASVLVIDPVHRTVATFGNIQEGNAHGSRFKWCQGVLGLDGIIYCVPCNASSVLAIDPSSRTVTTFGNLSEGECKWAGGALGHDGIIYCVPGSARTVLTINPVTRTVDEFDLGIPRIHTSLRSLEYRGVVRGADGIIYGIPFFASTLVAIDPSTRTVKAIGEFRDGNPKYYGGVVGPDGIIYGMPYDSCSSVLAIDTVDQTIQTFGNFERLAETCSHAWGCGALGLDGIIYCVPNRASTVLAIGTCSSWNPAVHQFFTSASKQLVRHLLLSLRRLGLTWQAMYQVLEFAIPRQPILGPQPVSPHCAATLEVSKIDQSTSRGVDAFQQGQNEGAEPTGSELATNVVIDHILHDEPPAAPHANDAGYRARRQQQIVDEEWAQNVQQRILNPDDSVPATEDIQEQEEIGIHIFEFSRTPEAYHRVFEDNIDLKACTVALQQTGFAASGLAKIFVDPPEYAAAANYSLEKQLQSRHVVASDRYEQAVRMAVRSLKGKNKVHEKRENRRKFVVGSQVQVTGLVNDKELNGCSGMALKYYEAKGRWAVRIDEDGREVLVQAKSLCLDDNVLLVKNTFIHIPIHSDASVSIGAQTY